MTTATIAQPTPASSHRFHLLDALRGVAAMLVILWHAEYIYPRGNRNTYLAVDFFFCLSGFVIAFSYERRLQTTLNFRNFMAARVIRLYPTFAAGLLCGVAVFLRLHRLRPSLFLPLVVMQAAMLPNYRVQVNGLAFPFNFPAWSLFFEMIANLGYVILVKTGLARTWHLAVLVAVSFLVLVRQPAAAHRLDVGWSDDPHGFLPGLARVTFSFLAGVLLLRLYRRAHIVLAKGPLHVAIALLLTCALVAALQSPLAFLQRDAVLYFDILVLFPAIVLIGAYLQLPRLLHPLCAFLGDVSYPIYLLHAALTPLSVALLSKLYLAHHAGARLSQIAVWTILGAEVVLMTAIAHVYVRYIDIPARRYLNHAYRARYDVRPIANTGQVTK